MVDGQGGGRHGPAARAEVAELHRMRQPALEIPLAKKDAAALAEQWALGATMTRIIDALDAL